MENTNPAVTYNQVDAKIPNARWWHIIPATILVYIVAFMDRTNIGIAIAGGMDKDLGITSSVAGAAAGIFFFGYLFLQIPGGHFAEKASAKKFIAWTIVFWGGLAVVSGFVQNTWQLMTVRFFLGVAEGGVYPAILALIGHWFPNKERARAIAFFQMNMAIAVIITSPISGWLIQNYNWRVMFIVEGLVSLALLFIWLPLVADHPKDAKWLSTQEREWIETELRKDAEENKRNQGALSKGGYKALYRSLNLWRMVAIYFFMSAGFYGFSLWMPTLISELTKTTMTVVGLLTAVPFIFTIIGQYIFAKLCDATMNRRLFTALSFFGIALSLALSVVLKENVWLSYGMLVCGGFFLNAWAGPYWSMPTLLFPTEALGGARGTINAIGSLGGFCGPYLVGLISLYLGSKMGVLMLVVSLIIAALLTLSLPKVTANK